MKYLVYLCCICTLIACGGDDDASEPEGVICTTSVEPSFRITVRDAADNNLLEGVTITAIENSYSAVLVAESPGVYSGPDERVGTYILSIEKENYQTITVTEPQIVELTENKCHVATISTTYIMEAQ